MSVSNLHYVDRLYGADNSFYTALSSDELKAAIEAAQTEADRCLEIADRITRSAKGREFTVPQKRDYDAATERLDKALVVRDAVNETIQHRDIDFGSAVGPFSLSDSGPSNQPYRAGEPLTRGQTMTGFVRANNLVNHGEESLSFGRAIRGIVTGNWQGADSERRAMAEGVLASGGYAVPTILSSQIVDLARNQTRVLAAGAQLLPMGSQTVDLARWEGDPVPDWRAENASIAVSDGLLGRVRLTAKSLAGITVLSRELLEDASNIDQLVSQAFAAQFAQQIDNMALYGTGTNNEPLGIKSTSGITNSAPPASGAIANWDFVVNAVGALRDDNESANGIIFSPRTERKLALLKDSTGQPLQVPSYLDGIPRYSTNQIPNDLGTNSDESDMFVADWSQLIVGVRTQLQISVLSERYADTGQVGILTFWRGDIAVARPKAFSVTSGLK